MLRLEQLSHTYQTSLTDKRRILDIPQWQFTAGDQVLLRGISGSGKTTLFNILAGLLSPTQGTIWFNEHSLYAMSETARDRFRAHNIGYMFQIHHLLPSLTSLENVIMPLAFADKMPASQRKTIASDLLAQVGLKDFLHHYPQQLSAGQRMRVSAVRALVNKPALLMTDEPTASLDEESANVVMDLLQEKCQERNAILLVASHDPSLSTRFSKMIFLQHGKLASEASKNA